MERNRLSLVDGFLALLQRHDARGMRVLAAAAVLTCAANLACTRDEASVRVEAPVESSRATLTAAVTTNGSNFNGTAIPAGRTLWFTSVMKVTGVGSAPVHLYLRDSHVTFAANGVSYTIDVPGADVTVDPAAALAATQFDSGANLWRTTLPKTFSGNGFLTAVAFPVAVDLPGGSNPVTWSGRFSADVPGISINWQWAAAVYTQFPTDYNAVQVKPVDDNQKSAYPNSDKAGTPEAYKAYVVGGARGGGGSNWTGSLSGTVAVSLAVQCSDVACGSSDQCHEVGICDPATGTCSNPAKPDGTLCNDGTLCTRTDTCQAGICVGADPVVCVAADQCHDPGVCDDATGGCSNPPTGDGKFCDDGDLCTHPDICDTGVCTAGARTVCVAADQCHDPGECQPSTGTCTTPPKLDGTACDDGIACTEVDVCMNGDCGGVAYACDDGLGCTSDVCNGDGTCTFAPNAGECAIEGACYAAGVANPANACQGCDPAQLSTWTAKPDGTPCSDGNACTRIDACTGGACLGSNVATCPPAPNCHIQPACIPATGGCSAPDNCAVCGDGLRELTEACDDGNTLGGDGCGATCTAEFCGDRVVTRTLAALSFSWLGRSCHADAPVEVVFTFNDVEVARGTLPVTCDCVPGTGTIAVTDLALLALGRNGSNTFGVHTSGELAWAVADVRTSAGQQTVTVWDAEGGGDAEARIPDLCAARAQAPVLEGSVVTLAAGEECDDGNILPGDGCSPECLSEKCHGVVCAALDACHDAGVCDPATGLCSNPIKPNGTTCDDRSRCTEASSCQEGSCIGSVSVICTASDACHDVGTCDPETGACSNPALPDGTSCNDGNACTLADSCRGGACTGSGERACPALDQCHDPGACDPSTGACVIPPKENGTPCDDGSACTRNDRCRAGVCVGDDGVACPVSDACHFAGICNPATGGCLNQPKPDGADCDDGDACTQESACQDGVCTGSSPVVCSALDTCRTAGTCDPATGQCSNPLKPAGASCNDGNPCNGGESTCDASGVCGRASAPPNVDDGNPCTVDSCDPATGKIKHDTAAAEGKLCAGTACASTQKVCRSGVCATDNVVQPYGGIDWKYKVYPYGTVPANYGRFTFDDSSYAIGSAPFAVPGNFCAIQTKSKTNWPVSTEIVIRKVLPLPAGFGRLHIKIAIDNDVEVIINETNVTHGLQSHEGCADVNVLQFDVPDSVLTPGSNLIAVRARDRGFVNGLDIEITAIQSQLTPRNDGNPCTVDSCGPSGELHTPLPDGTSCSDSNLCNGAEICTAGACVPGTPPPRDDGNLCTLDTCDSLFGLQHVVQPDGTLCSNGDVCDGVETCQGGECRLGTPLVADDGNPCTSDGCGPVYGVSHERAPDGTACGDGAHCQSGYCWHNRPPTVSAGPDQTLRVAPMSHPVLTTTLAGAVSDDGVPGPTVALGWTLVSGPGPAVFANATAPGTAVTLSTTGTYVLRLFANDGELTASDDVVITVASEGSNLPPIVNCRPGLTLPLSSDPQTVTCRVGDDGLPLDAGLSGSWDQVSGPAAVTFADSTTSAANVVFPATGTYVLRLVVSDTEVSGQDNLTVVVQSDPQNLAPVVNAGQDQSVSLPTLTVALVGSASDDGRPTGATMATRWTMVSGPDLVIFSTPLALSTPAKFSAPGTYVLRLTASDGELSTSDDLVVRVEAMAPVGPPPTVAIAAPTDMAAVTQPTPIRGTVVSDALLGWRVEYRELSLGDEWITLATGDHTVTDAVLGTFDPTLMLNGSYQIRLVATDLSGRVATSPADGRVLNVRGNLKVGHLTLSFLEMTVPMAGLPISLYRNYDSRDPRKGDFGYGWTLNASGYRVSESGRAGRNWAVVQQPGFLPSYCVQPMRQNRVTVTVPGGKSYEFEAVAEDGCETFFEPSLVTLAFRALPGTHASLSPADGGVAFVQEGQLYDSDFQIYDPTTYVLTLPEGQELVVADRSAPGGPGLRSIKDRNGNTLTVELGRITHSAGKSVVIERDGEGRITFITDPSGHQLSYAYSPSGDLANVTDREGNTTSFTYYDEPAHRLRDIFDPRGVRAVRNEYDPVDGRLVKSIDANGDALLYAHDLAANQEIITDRTGAQRVLTYDSHGNVTKEVDAEGGVITRNFDGEDNRKTETDADGHTTKWEYDAAGNVKQMTDPLEKTTYYTYNAWSQVETTKDSLGHVTTNVYDPRNGNLLSTKDGLGHATTFTYHADGNLKSRTNRLNFTTFYGYDQFGHLTSEGDALDNVTTYTYDENGNRKTETRVRTRADGARETLVTRYTYDKNDRLLTTTLPDQSVTGATYNPAGLGATSVDALNRTTLHTYDDLGRLTDTEYPDHSHSSATYDEEGRRKTSTDRAGRTTTMDYDRVGRLKKTTYVDQSFTTTEYYPSGRVLSTTDAGNHTTRYEYDAAGRQIKVTDPMNKSTTFTYDDSGNQLTVTDALDHTTTSFYDANNRLWKTQFHDNTTRTTTYDDEGQRIAETDQANKTTRFGYDPLGRLSSVTDALDQVTRYGYDEVGNRISVTDAANKTTRYLYDRVGRETKRILPDASFELKAYQPDGALWTRSDLQRRTTTYGYDLAGRLASKTYPDQTTVGFTYTPNGRRETATDVRGTTHYTYDERDRLKSIEYPDGKRIEYGYDPEGRKVSLTAKAGSASLPTGYGYDVLDRIESVIDPDGRVFDLEFNDVGNLAKVVRPNGADTAYTHDALNRLTKIRTYARATDTTIASYGYSLGPTGIRKRVDEGDGTARVYEYDELYRLTKETVTGAQNYEKTFGYDAVSNRISQTTTGAEVDAGAGGGAVDAAVGSGMGTITYTYDNRDRLTGENGTVYSWSENGNLVGRSGEATYEWDFEDRLVKVTKVDGTVVENVYDVDGVLVGMRVNGVGTDLLVDTSGGLSHVVAEVDSSGTVTALYVRAGNMLLEEIRGGVAKMYEADGLGSVRGLLDTSGAKTDTYAYEAFGSTVSSTCSDANPYRFAGERFVEGAGMYQNRARWLDTKVGRFASVDRSRGVSEQPITLHGYLYGNVRPVDTIDPSGRDGWTIADVTITVVVVGVLAVQAYNNYAERYLLPFWNNRSAQELDFARRHPEVLSVVQRTGVEATAATQIWFTPDERQDGAVGNAFKHAYWNALMAQGMGIALAREYGDAHEAIAADGNRALPLGDDTIMDLYNNDVGRRIGISGGSSFGKVLDAISGGQLMWIIGAQYSAVEWGPGMIAAGWEWPPNRSPRPWP